MESLNLPISQSSPIQLRAICWEGLAVQIQIRFSQSCLFSPVLQDADSSCFEPADGNSVSAVRGAAVLGKPGTGKDLSFVSSSRRKKEIQEEMEFFGFGILSWFSSWGKWKFM